MDRAGDHEGGGPSRLPEHLRGDHIRDGTCNTTLRCGQPQPSRLRHSITSQRFAECGSRQPNKPGVYHYMSAGALTTLGVNGPECCHRRVSRQPPPNHPPSCSVALTGSDGMSDDVDDDAGDADVGHPRDALLPKHTTASRWYY